jgi:hypothetical protein
MLRIDEMVWELCNKERYILDLDMLRIDEVVWELCNEERVVARAPPGFSPICT